VSKLLAIRREPRRRRPRAVPLLLALSLACLAAAHGASADRVTLRMRVPGGKKMSRIGPHLRAAMQRKRSPLAPRIKANAGMLPRIYLTVPRNISSGAPTVARGRVARSPRHAGVLLERRRSHRWMLLAHGRVRHGRFRVHFSLAGGSQETRVRAVLVQGRRRLAKSLARKVWVRTPAKAPGRLYWGAWIGSQLTGTAAPWDMSAVSKFAQMVGKPLSLLQFSSPFADCSSSNCSYYEFPTEAFDQIRARGAIPFLSWSSELLSGDGSAPTFQLSDLLAGAYDEYIREFAESARTWGHPFFLRFDWEMNGDWFPWGDGVNGNQPAEFAAAWRRVHDIFASAGATNATWVWCPYVNRNADLASLYPGDDYVDWTCLDGYNWGANPALRRSWKGFSTLFSSTYHQVTDTIAPGKPMLIGETGSTEDGGSKAAWIEEMFEALPTAFPAVRGLLWFEAYGNGMDWPLETSQSAISAFAAGIGDSRYLGNSFGGLEASPIPPP
jgi:glycosyl hydrolase family 26